MCLIVARKLADPDPKITTIAVAPAFSLSWWSILFLFLTTVQPRSFLPTFVHLLVIFCSDHSRFDVSVRSLILLLSEEGK